MASSATAYGAWPDNPVPISEDWPIAGPSNCHSGRCNWRPRSGGDCVCRFSIFPPACIISPGIPGSFRQPVCRTNWDFNSDTRANKHCWRCGWSTVARKVAANQSPWRPLFVATPARLVTMSPRSARRRRSSGWPVLRCTSFANVAVSDRLRSRSTGWLTVMHIIEIGSRGCRSTRSMRSGTLPS